MLLARSSANRTIFCAKSNIFPGQREWNTGMEHFNKTYNFIGSQQCESFMNITILALNRVFSQWCLYSQTGYWIHTLPVMVQIS